MHTSIQVDANPKIPFYISRTYVLTFCCAFVYKRSLWSHMFAMKIFAYSKASMLDRKSGYANTIRVVCRCRCGYIYRFDFSSFQYFYYAHIFTIYVNMLNMRNILKPLKEKY